MTQGAAAARRLTIMVVVALGVAGLAGCGKDEAPPAPSSSSSTPAPTSPSPTPSPTPTAPTPPAPTPPAKPAEWTQNDDAGALAAAQYFMDLYNYVRATGDLADWRTVTLPTCQFCSNVAALAEATYGAGNTLRDSAISVTGAQISGRSESLGVTGVQVAYSSGEFGEYDSSGDLVRRFEPESGYLVLDLAPVSDGWQLAELTSHDAQVAP